MPTSMAQKAQSAYGIPSPGCNVLALLDTFYASGFVTVSSPSNPMLKGRTLHTLYAVSFIVYSSNCICDWIHVYCTLRGFVTTFPLRTWLVFSIVIAVVSGTMLTALLLVLCVENAFIHSRRIAEYSSGWSVIVEAIIEWIQAFNNFRIAFLVLLLHDAPMTFINFFIISACRCADSEIWPWSLLMSSLSTIVSVLWRLTMLYFAYRRMLNQNKRKKSQLPIGQQKPSFLEHINASCSISNGGRLREFDETWPFRWAKSRLHREKIEEESDLQKDRYVAYLRSDLCPSKCRIPEISRNACGICCGFIRVKGCQWMKGIAKGVALGVLVALGYLFYIATFCLPCCFHYMCRKRSFYSRHRCSKSCVRFFSIFFHYSLFTFSLFGVAVLLVSNVILISSVQVIGINQIPPELGTLCVEVDRQTHTIRTLLKPSWDDPRHVCKPVWENGGLGWALHRSSAGPWQTRIPVSRRNMIVVSTYLVMNYSDPNEPSHAMIYDYAVLINIGEGRRFRCRSGDATVWRYDPTLNVDKLPWPYFSGCSNSLRTERRRMIDCEKMERQQNSERKNVLRA